MFKIVRYNAGQADEWNQFVVQSKNGTFLFDRQYMDYHADRFHDHSLLFYRDEKLYALFPANENGNILYSHQGLTYGGLVMGTEATTVHVMECFQLLRQYLQDHDFHRVIYKSIPWIYHQIPAEEPLYAMYRVFDYRLMERDVSSTIVLAKPLKWKKDRRHGLHVASNNGIRVEKSDNYAEFWQILKENLQKCHGVSPVHTLDEILLLHQRFPSSIVLYAAYREQQMLGGCVVYITSQVVHTQYISSTAEGKRLGVVNAIIKEIIVAYPEYMYLDFGKSTETHSDILNENLIYQKEGFGARAVCYDTYEWNV